jgi:hypothetical protein
LLKTTHKDDPQSQTVSEINPGNENKAGFSSWGKGNKIMEPKSDFPQFSKNLTFSEAKKQSNSKNIFFKKAHKFCKYRRASEKKILRIKKITKRKSWKK